MKHRLLALPVLVSLGLAVSSCQSPRENIGLFLYDANDTFVSMLAENLNTSLSDSYSLATYDAKKSQVIQNNQIIDSLENEKPDVLLVNMVDRLSSSAIIQKSQQNNTPVIFFNREPVKSDIINYSDVYYVGTNPLQEGINQAIMAIELLGSPDNISRDIDKNGDNKLQCVFIQGEQNHQDTEQRTYSCIEYLQNKGYELDILAMESADWNKDKGAITMSNLYSKYGDSIEFVFSNNDDMALGAIDYLINKDNKPSEDLEATKPTESESIALANTSKKAKRLPFPIVGVDGTEAGLKSVADGLLYGTTINNAKKQAKAIYMLIQLLNKEITFSDFNEEFNFNENERYIYVSGSLVSQKTKPTKKTKAL